MCPPPDLFISAAEPSADLQGALLFSKLPPDLTIIGMLGPRMRDSGRATCLIPMEKVQVMGFSEVIRALPRLLKTLNSLTEEILAHHPPVVLTIDAPDFHLRLAKKLRERGFRGKLVHLVCPTIWAWKKGRKKVLETLFDQLLCIFPFEPALFANSPLLVDYVGNPSFEALDTTPLTHTHITLFPGSRPDIVRKNLPLQLQAAQELSQRHHLPIAISVAHASLQPLIRSIAPSIEQVEDRSLLMAKSALSIATCGTVVLDLALRGVPTVVTYLVSTWSGALARLIGLRLQRYSLPNILLQRDALVELIWIHCTADKMVSAGEKLLQGNTETAIVQKELQKLLHTSSPFSTQVAQHLQTLLSQPRS